MIIGRQHEIELLSQLNASVNAELVVVHGRRRVGKTFLIREYYKNNLVFDFVGSNIETYPTQMSNFNTAFAQQCTTRYADAQNWSDAFNNLAKYLKSLPKNKKAVVFFDEFPWFDKPLSGFLGAFEYFWNQHASTMKHVIFIACGSVASWLIKHLLNNYDGLHNRVTLQIEVMPFNLHEVEQFIKYKNLRFTQYQILQLYMAVGGIPFYLERIKNSASVAQAIDKLFFLPNAPLRNEFASLYKSLFKSPAGYINIIKVLAQHHYGLDRTTLLAKSILPAGGSFNRVMETLEECGFVMKLQPYGKKNKNATYRLIDLFSVFYCKFVEEEKSTKRSVFASIANTALYRSWCGYAFENICLLHIPQIQKSLGIAGLQVRTSSWKVQKNAETAGAQIDIIIDRKDGITHLCEVKFTSKSFITTSKIRKDWSDKRAIFEHHTNTKNAVVTTFIGTYLPSQNAFFADEVHSTILMSDIFSTPY